MVNFILGVVIIFITDGEHFVNLNKDAHHSIHFQRAWNKYKQESFVFEIIETIQDENNKLTREQYWLDYYKPYKRDIGYNIYPSATGGGRKLTIEEKEKIRIIPFSEHERIVDLYNDGESIINISEIYKVNTENIWRILRENNVDTSDIRIISYNNADYTLRQFSEEFNIDIKLITARYNKGYMNAEDYFKTTEEMLIEKDLLHIITINSKEYTFKELEKEFNIKCGTIRSRFYNGLNGEDLVKPIQKTIPEREKENIIELLKQGVNLINIGLIYEKSNATICRYLAKYSIGFKDYFNYYKVNQIIKSK